MKNLKLTLTGLFIAALLTFTGCEHVDEYYDNIPPSPPRNVYSVTGDGRVDIYWDYNNESDVAGYNVYYSYSYDGKYTLIGSTHNDYYVDYGAKNGETYYYAVTAYDFNGNESELSIDEVYDTPRPEGFNQAIFDYLNYPNNSGYDFSDFRVVPYNSDNADMFFENYQGTYYLNVWDDSDIQDMGLTNNIYDISVAPSSGWVPLIEGENVKYVQVIPGHTYVVWTWDNHFAKVRVTNITNERMVFDWAYQTSEGNRELKRNPESGMRNGTHSEVIKSH